MAHVTTGMRNRIMWEDHICYLKHLRPILEAFLTHSEPLIVVGDWNQRIPQPGASKSDAQLALMEGIPAALEIVTQGEIAAIGGRLIDHLAISKALEASGFNYFGPRTRDGKPLSDHVGYTVELG